MSGAEGQPSPLLTVLDASASAPRAAVVSSPLHRWGVRLVRLTLLLTAFGLLFLARSRDQSRLVVDSVTLEEARLLLPEATALGPRDPVRNGHPVLDGSRQVIGFVLKTSPEADRIVGYAGPSNLLVALSPEGAVMGCRLLSSRETPEHVKAVEQGTAFWNSLKGWRPGAGRLPDVDAVSGSTLTSLALVESIQARLGAAPVSLRFPKEVTLEEARQIDSDAARLEPDKPRPGWIAVRNAEDRISSYLLRTSPEAETVSGYGGPTEALVAITADQQTVTAVRLRSSYDTPEYVERVRDDGRWLDQLAGRSLTDWAKIDFKAAGIEGVSGATQTSYGVAEGIRRRLVREMQAPVRTNSTWLSGRGVALLLVIAGGLAMTFWRRLAGRRNRLVWQVVLVVGYGLLLGDLFSLALVNGTIGSGQLSERAPALLALVVVSLLVPWGTRQQIYCHQLCPHGAVQEWLGRFRRWQRPVPATLGKWLALIPGTLLLVAFGLALARPDWNLAALEPFDAWVLGTAATASFIIAVIGMAASLIVPQAYCRFGCPTGSLLKFIRSHGSAERLGLRDAVAATAVGLASIGMAATSTRSMTGNETANVLQQGQAPVENPALRISGRAFGTSWSVRFRQPVTDRLELQDDVAELLEGIESRLSHWRPGSETSQFNASETTLEIDCSRELVDLVQLGQQLSEATNGRFDLTAAPLVDAWGYGPSGPKSEPPSAAEIEALLPAVGWYKLQLDPEIPSLRKRDPRLKLDLGSLLHGLAVDRVFELLKAKGLSEYLVEVGGELRAGGEWTVAIEPVRPDQTSVTRLDLKDAALSTSGTYRPANADGTPDRHIISPQTGQPVETPWLAVSVMAATCLEADAWDTALMVDPDAIELARKQGLTVQIFGKDGQVHRLGNWAEPANGAGSETR